MRPVRCDELIKRINKVITDWSQEQDFWIKHEGALVTMTERVDVYNGYEIKIQYPFVIKRPKYDEIERGEREP
jgi:hypothetical protein